ncbi:hypothetical protein BT69DRAFT_1372513 [Atractiella rhizophila]|nr:hypothetical protein BT69DRAFT_1372513 [Atractiella rhizophila]
MATYALSTLRSSIFSLPTSQYIVNPSLLDSLQALEGDTALTIDTLQPFLEQVLQMGNAGAGGKDKQILLAAYRCLETCKDRGSMIKQVKVVQWAVKLEDFVKESSETNEDMKPEVTSMTVDSLGQEEGQRLQSVTSAKFSDSGQTSTTPTSPSQTIHSTRTSLTAATSAMSLKQSNERDTDAPPSTSPSDGHAPPRLGSPGPVKRRSYAADGRHSKKRRTSSLAVSDGLRSGSTSGSARLIESPLEMEETTVQNHSRSPQLSDISSLPSNPKPNLRDRSLLTMGKGGSRAKNAVTESSSSESGRPLRHNSTKREAISTSTAQADPDVSQIQTAESIEDKGTPRFQQHACTSETFCRYPKCYICQLQIEDECLFQYVRVFDWKSRSSANGDTEEYISDGPFFETLIDDTELPRYRLPDDFATKLNEEALKYMMDRISLQLAHDFDAHWQHQEKMYGWLRSQSTSGNVKELVIKRQSLEDAFSCDVCSTGILQAYYFCGDCGRTHCPGCFELLREISEGGKGGGLTRAAAKRVTDCLPKLKKNWSKTKGKVENISKVEFKTHSASSFFAYHCHPHEEYLATKYAVQDVADAVALPPDICHPPSITFLTSESDLNSFAGAWQLATWTGPVVQKGLKIGDQWKLIRIKQELGTVEADICNLKGTSARRVDHYQRCSVAQFLSHFDSDCNHDNAFRLSDVPIRPSSMQDAAEELLPFPDWTNPTGFRNVLSYLPANSLLPDLGVRLDFAAKAGNQFRLPPSTFRIQADQHDVVDVLLYAKDPIKQVRGEAIWDFFPVGQIPTVRFLCAGCSCSSVDKCNASAESVSVRDHSSRRTNNGCRGDAKFRRSLFQQDALSFG